MKLAPEDVGPRWVATAEALFLQRSTAGSQQLLYDPGASAGLLSASNLDFSLNAGPRLTLRRDGPAGLGLELIYFGIDGWQSSADFPNSAFTYGVGNLAIDKTMTVPVSDARFQDTSRIYSGEINLRPMHGTIGSLPWRACVGSSSRTATRSTARTISFPLPLPTWSEAITIFMALKSGWMPAGGMVRGDSRSTSGEKPASTARRRPRTTTTRTRSAAFRQAPRLPRCRSSARWG